jgi:hypothetical protein
MHLTERSIFEKQGGTAEFSAPGVGRFFILEDECLNQ